VTDAATGGVIGVRWSLRLSFYCSVSQESSFATSVMFAARRVVAKIYMVLRVPGAGEPSTLI
jgi:hypothetical protein